MQRRKGVEESPLIGEVEGKKDDKFERIAKEPNGPSGVAVLWTKILALVFGTIFGFLISYLVIGSIWVNCPSVYGRICNDRGTCSNSVCECTDPFYSGNACQDTLVLGYLRSTNEECSGNGIVSPYSLSSDITPVCVLFGWDNTRCKTAIDNIRLKISKDQSVTAEEVKTTPICFCSPPYTGVACEIDARATLSNIEGNLCSGRGNVTVDYFWNDTGRVSRGVQCKEDASLFLLPSLGLVSFAVAEQIRSKYLFEFSRGFCSGSPIIISGDAVIPGGQISSNYVCRCAEPFTGDVCQFGRCPTDELDRTCSAHGNPLYGFGAERNTSRNDVGECTPVCNAYTCEDGTCKPSKSLCERKNSPTKCPPDAPYRCSTGECTAGTSAEHGDLYCKDGLEYGWVDDINSVRSPCTEGVLCGGSESTLTSSGRISPGGHLNFTSPLVYYRMRLSQGAIVTFREGNRVVDTKTAEFDGDQMYGVIQRTYEEVESEGFEGEGVDVITIKEYGDGFAIWPAPYLLKVSTTVPERYRVIQLRSLGGLYSTVSVRSSIVVHDDRSEYALARESDGRILKPSGGLVSNETCYEDLASCVWNATTRQSLDGSRKVCSVNGELLSLPTTSCANITLDERVYTAMVGSSRDNTDQISYGNWYLYTRKSVYEYEYSIEGGPVFDVEYLSVDDLRRPCVCVPMGQNQTTYNDIYFRQLKRSVPTEVGDYAVGQRLVDGDARLFRGTMTKVGDPLEMIIEGYSDPVELIMARELSKYEYLLGNPQCDTDVYPSRYPNGVCARLETRNLTIPVECDCSSVFNSTSCVCDGAITTSFGCECSEVECVCEGDGAFVFAGVLFDYIQSLHSETCIVTRVGDERGATRGIGGPTNTPVSVPSSSPVSNLSIVPSTSPSVSEVGNWTFVSESQEFPGFPREFDIPGGCWMDARLFGISRLFTDVYTEFNVTVECDTDSTIVIPILSLDKVWDEWIIETTSPYAPIAYWTPTGVPVTYVTGVTMTAQSNSVDADKVLMNSNETWTSGSVAHRTWIQSNFDREVWVNAVWLNLRTGGLYRPDGNLPVEIEVEYHEDGVWKRYNKITSTVVNGTELKLILPKNGEAKQTSSIRLSSYLDMDIRIFLPLTDQTCSSGRLVGYSNNIGVRVTDAYSRQNLSVPCVSVDDCFINGFDATKDGICQDARYIYGPQVERKIRTSYYEPWEPVAISLGLPQNKSFVSEWAAENATLYRFQLPNIVCPSFDSLFDANTTLYDGFNNNGSCVWYFKLNVESVEFDSSNGQLSDYVNQFVSPGDPGNSPYCLAGTDVSDCGSSNRYADIDKNLRCLDDDTRKDLEDRGEFTTTEGYEIETFLIYGASFIFSTSDLKLNLVRVGRDSAYLEDCSSELLCDDGTCADTQCPDTRYNCAGDGCALADPNLDEYACACEKGYGGISCGVHRTNEGDPKKFTLDPATWHSAGRPPPMRMKPPGGYVRGQYRTEDVEAFMFPSGDVTGTDPLILDDFAPYGNIFVRYVDSGVNSGFYTTCFYYRATPWGTPVSYRDSVVEYNPDGSVKRWRKFKDANDNEIEYSWSKYTEYDEFPYRCPKTGHCVAKESDCYQMDVIDPNCNDRGFPLADGTCECFTGWRTFLFTDEFTNTKSVPYTVVDEITGDTNPTIWGGRPNNNWRVWGPQWCQARDCNTVDCARPIGCFPGTPRLNFQDRLTSCSELSGYGEMCGIDSNACSRGEVVPPLVCSGKGVLRRRSYTDPDEWYCECGDTISNEAEETTELVRNGWGGPKCDQYYCNRPLYESIWFLPYDVVEQRAYVDIFGRDLPGVYRSNNCGAPVGPDPAELQTWQNCCPGETRLERCTTIPCNVGNQVQCLTHAECQGVRRKPLVYSCNNHGRARVDGTCECDEGYTYELDRFSEKGCFRKVNCPVAARSQKVCNALPSCSADLESWILPRVPYFEQQIWTALAIMGEPVTNESYVRYVGSSLGALESIKEQAYVSAALRVIAAEIDFSACIAVFPDDDPADPRGMRPYADETDLIFYKRGFSFPYKIDLDLGILTDGLLWSGDYQQEGVQYEVFRYVNSGGELVIPLGGEYYVNYVRVHGRKAATDNTEMQFSIRGDSNQELCLGSSGYSMIIRDYDGDAGLEGIWVTQTCGNLYRDFPFSQVQLELNCGVRLDTESCIVFQTTQCKLGNGIIRDPASPDPFPGCTSLCCEQVSFAQKTSNLIISYEPLTANAELGVEYFMDELQIFGYGEVVLDIPPLLDAELLNRAGGESSGCQDYLFLQSQLGNQGSNYIAADYRDRVANRAENVIQVLYDVAQAAPDICNSTGGKFATAISGEPFEDYANTQGVACYSSELSLNTQEQGCIVNARDTTNYLTAPIESVIEPSCSSWGCWSSYPGFRYDIYSVPDIRNSNPSFWGNIYRTNGVPNQVPWPDAALRMMQDNLNQFQVRMEYVYVPLIVPPITTFLPPVTDYALGNSYFLWTAGYPSSYWRFTQVVAMQTPGTPEVNLQEPVLVTRAAKPYIANSTSVLQNQIRRQNRILTATYYYQTRTSDNILIPIPKSYGFQYERVPLRDISNVVYNGAAQNTGALLGSFSSQQYEMATDVRDSVIETESWTNPKVCVVRFWTDNACGAARWDPRFGIITYRDLYLQFEVKPGNDYFFLYKNLASGQRMIEDCVGASADVCTGCGDNCIVPKLLSGLPASAYSVTVEGPCDLYGVTEDNAETFKFEGEDDPQSQQRPFHYSFQSYGPGGVFGVSGSFTSTREGRRGACYSQNYGLRDGLSKWYILPRFRSAKVRTRVKARKEASGDNSNYNIGWNSHPFMLANVEVELMATLGRFGPPESRTGLDTKFGLQPYDNDCGIVRPSGVSLRNWEAVDLGMVCVFKPWLAGGSETKIPRYFDSTKPSMILTNDNLDISTPFSVPTTREVKECQRCPVPLRRGNWVWVQEVQTGTLSEFVTNVERIFEVGSNEVTSDVRPQLHLFDGPSVLTVVEHRVNNILENARNMAYWRKSEYLSEWYLDQCVKVIRVPGTSSTYRYVPTVCESEHTILCQRDQNKYTVRSGMQADECGDSGRPLGIAQPNATCFERYALADASLFPNAHAIRSAYSSGRLGEYIETTVYDYDEAYAFFQNETNSYALSFDILQSRLQEGSSDRPGYVTSGSVSNPYSWVDFAIPDKYPIDCGPVRDPQTGIEKNLCAETIDKCRTEFLGNASDLSLDEYPQILKPVGESENHRFIARCGTICKPAAYNVRDNFGAGILTTVDVNFVSDVSDGGVQLQAQGVNGTWMNTGKNVHGYTLVSNLTTYITGSIECSGECEMTLLMSELVPSYGIPSNVVELVSRTGSGEYSTVYTSSNDSVVYQIFGWRFTNLDAGETITIKPLILSNDFTISRCQEDLLIRDWLNSPAVIESGQILNNECVTTDDQLSRLPLSEVGKCYCKGRAYGGDACDELALDTSESSRVCGGWGDGPSRAIAPDGSVVDVNDRGTFYSGFNDPGCKCIDFGSVLKTYRNPVQGSGFDYVLSVDKPGNEPDFELVPLPPATEIIAITPPLDYEDVSAVCASGSANLPSWLSSAQVSEYYIEYSDRANYVDLAIVDDSLVWDKRGFTIASGISGNSSTIVVPVDVGLINALNFNNLGYQFGTPDTVGATDGLLVSYTQPIGTTFAATPSVITFSVSFDGPVEVSIYAPSPPGTGTVLAQISTNGASPITCATGVDTGKGYYRILCDVNVGSSNEIRFIAGTSTSQIWEEVLVLKQMFTSSGQNVVAGRTVYYRY